MSVVVSVLGSASASATNRVNRLSHPWHGILWEAAWIDILRKSVVETKPKHTTRLARSRARIEGPCVACINHVSCNTYVIHS